MIDAPKVSVLLCTNSANFLSESIDSVLSQTFRNFELIVVLNNAPNEAIWILDSYNDPRIRVIQSKISQLSYNLNVAADAAKGEYIMRMDADDICDCQRMELQVNFLEENNQYGVVSSNCYLIDENSSVVGEKKYPTADLDIRRSLRFRNPICHPSVMFRRSILLEIGGYRGFKNSQDYEFWIRVANDTTYKFFNLNQPLLKYRIHSNQSKGSISAYADHLSVLFRNLLERPSLTPFFLFRFFQYCFFKLKGKF
ncbi:glycosyltransferase [Aeromonas enteropelogenes]|uniref:glycosyltransferase n=1 Tax=Aeromonas enteropelogenes TaxID=29489 RepID=UPI003B9E0CAD